VCHVPAQPLFLPRSAPALECQAAQLVSAILVASAPNLPGTGSAAQADAGKQQQQQQQQQQPFVSEQLAAAEQPLIALQQMYQQEPELSVQPLRHPRLMQLLLSGGCWLIIHAEIMALQALTGADPGQQQQQQQCKAPVPE
jgi:hypothetical protein